MSGLSGGLAARGVHFAYTPGRPVLTDVSAQVRPGVVTAVAGPNGAGKTTLLRLLLGVLRPQAGSVTLEGREVSSIPDARRARSVAYLPQRTSVAFGFTVREVVRLGRYASGPFRSGDTEPIEAALARVGLSDRADAPLGTLSAGQQQRAAMARALAQLAGETGPRFLLADEPVSALDPRHALLTMSLLRELAREGVGVLVVLHDLTSAARFADTAIVLDRTGRVASDGAVAGALDPVRLRDIYGVEFARLSSADAAALVPVRAL